ncbi:MAG: phenylalanine--tRNA ligase subunit beta [Rhodobacteraceae bacterium]|nr:phenylalanine--tRNA ligase subunit beta [Paracoccaceae bacterium]
MKFTLSWLKTHLDTEATLDEITYALTDLGLEVEGVENPADTLGAFRLCRVIEAVQHPNADRLQLCRVETYPNGPDGRTEEVQVVCGAPNARTGLVGVFAPVGAYVPGIDLTLKAGKIRDVESLGMLCSERELMISDEHDGIIDLPADAPLGARFIDYLDRNDPVIDIAITPNRPDALGVRGIARDLAARGLGKLKPAPVAKIEGNFPCPIAVSIDQDALKDAPVFTGRLIKGVKNTPSPQWLQDRLRAIGLRPISTLVDITNFFTYDLNRPLHVFDADKVSGGLRVQYAAGGEAMMALDDNEYTLNAGMMVISDDNGPQSIAGIMGGAASGCSSDTVNVFVESAYWDPIAIAMTGRKLKINSDARYRFERGIDPAFTPEGLDLATAMILELCGGEPSEMVMAGEVPDTSRAYKLNPSRVVSLVGMEISESEQIRILTDLGFEVKDLMVHVPSWRPDVHGEADLVEEIARVASLTKLVGKPLSRPGVGVMKPVLTPSQKRLMTLRRALALGLNECVTYSFIDQKSAALFGGGSDAVRLSNPISSEMSHMRPDILPSLLQAAARNQARGEADMALFEIGQGFNGPEPEDQRTIACGIRVGSTAPRNAFGTRRNVDIYDAKGDAEAALAAIGAPVGNLMVLRNAPEWFHPGRSAVLSLGPKNPLAIFGELHPKVLKQMGVKGAVVGFTIFPENVPLKKAKSKTRPALGGSDLQAVERDFAFVVDATLEVEKLVKAAKGGDKKLIEAVNVFDIFSGAKAEAQMGAGKKSVAITVRIQPKAATLTDKEIEAISAKIVASVAKQTGGELRS